MTLWPGKIAQQIKDINKIKSVLLKINYNNFDVYFCYHIKLSLCYGLGAEIRNCD